MKFLTPVQARFARDKSRVVSNAHPALLDFWKPGDAVAPRSAPAAFREGIRAAPLG